jgi:hypothetical protein
MTNHKPAHNTAMVYIKVASNRENEQSESGTIAVVTVLRRSRKSL